jgi:hypothetical protein
LRVRWKRFCRPIESTEMLSSSLGC